jgi:hypothetical protein
LAACASLDDDAAKDMGESIARTHESVALLDRAAQRDEWTEVLRELVARGSIDSKGESAGVLSARRPIHGLVRGGACRLLVEQRSLDAAELERLARLALSPAQPPAQAAAWAEGLLRGSALLLLHHDGVWRALDEWITSLADAAFVEMLPLVRRAFADFGPAERRQMAEKVRARGRPARAPRTTSMRRARRSSLRCCL